MKNSALLGLALTGMIFSGTAFTESTQKKMDHAAMMKTTGHDPHFLDMMIEHHKDGIKMAEMATQKAQGQEIKTMANKILKDQKKELKQMQEWRQEKFASIPKSEDMMPKMDMNKLENSKGAEFDKNFVMMMASHHEDGIKMAEEAIPMLKNNQIKQFAQNASKNQTKEMNQLHEMHSSLEKKTSTGTGTGSAEE